MKSCKRIVFTARIFLSPISADALVKKVYTATRQKVRMMMSLLILKNCFIAARSIISLHDTFTSLLLYIMVMITTIVTTPVHCATTEAKAMPSMLIEPTIEKR